MTRGVQITRTPRFLTGVLRRAQSRTFERLLRGIEVARDEAEWLDRNRKEMT
jgi:hypothetical protein